MTNTMRLAVNEFKLFRFSYLGSVLFFAAYSIFFSMFLDNAINGESVVLLDLVVLLFGQIFGLGMTKYHFFNPYRQDPFTRRMRVLRRLPVRTAEIVVARIVSMIVLAIVNTVVFFVPAYWISASTQQLLSLTELFAFLYFVLLFSIVSGCFYIYLETGYSGRRYWAISLILMGITLAAVIVMMVTGANVTMWMLTEAQGGYGWFANIVASAVAAFFVYWSAHLMIRRLDRRDYYN